MSGAEDGHVLDQMARLNLRALFTIDSYPGYVFVEATTLQDVEELAHITSRSVDTPKVMPVSLLDAACILDMRGAKRNDILVGSWVRLRRGEMYNGDLAFILSMDPRRDGCVMALTIPRIFPLNDSNRLLTKRKRVTLRPAQAFFDPVQFSTRATEVLDDSCTKMPATACASYWKFEGQVYWHGLCLLSIASQSLNFQPVEPSVDELALWFDCGVPEVLQSIAALQHRLSNKSGMDIQRDDRVLVHDMEMDETIGTVVEVEGAFITEKASLRVLVKLPDNQVKWYWGADIEKHFVSGDRVTMSSGMHDGSGGWVLTIKGDEAIIMLDSGENVRVMMAFKYNTHIH